MTNVVLADETFYRTRSPIIIFQVSNTKEPMNNYIGSVFVKHEQPPPGKVKIYTSKNRGGPWKQIYESETQVKNDDSSEYSYF